MYTRLPSLVLISALGLAALPVAAAEEAPDVTHDGLHKIPSKVAYAWVLPEADFARYNKVIILDTFVAFKKHWERDHKRATKSDMERIKRGLAEMFRNVFTEVLEGGGYPVVTEPGDDVLVLRPALIDLDVTAPDLPTAGRVTNYVTSAGAVTLYLELFDSETSAILARAVDRKAARDSGIFQMSSSVYNSAEAKRVLTQWATLLKDRLNEIHGKAAQ